MSNFPNKLDTDADLPSVIDGSTEISAEVLNGHKEAILAIEIAIGEDINGSMSSLAERLDVAINPDGTIKTSVLESAGLVSLPITNSHVGSSAGIEESKLDLDFSTSSLNDQIASNDIDIYNLQISQTATSGTLATHIAGTANKHPASDITTTPVLGQSTVQNALAALASEISDHIASTEAHASEDITYVYSDSEVSVENVKDALDILFDGSAQGIRNHFNLAHDSGIKLNTDSGGVLLLSKYTPLGGNDIVKISNPNNPTIRSSGFNPFSLNASASNIDFTYFDGYVEQNLSVTGLNLSSYITSDNRLEGVVANLNASFSAVRAPMFAFQDRGELVIQHGMPDGYFAVSSPANSAVTALGLDSFVDTAIYSNSDSKMVVNGVVLDSLQDVISKEVTLSSSNSILTINESLPVGSLVYISEHSDSGVYQVISSTSSTITLNATISAGSMLLRAWSDSVKIEGSAKQTFDVLIDSSGLSSKSKKLQVNTSQISNIPIVYSNLPSGNWSLHLTGSGSNRYLKIFDGTYYGETIQFTNGWTGYLDIPSADSRYFVKINVASESITYPATDSFTVYYSDINSASMQIGSFWTTGSSTDNPVDLRKLDLNSEPLDYRIGQSLVLAGVSLSVSGDQISVSSGEVLICGKKLRIAASVFDFASQTGNFIIWIDQTGAYRVTNFGSGAIAKEIYNKGGLLLAYVVASSGLSSYKDWRVYERDASSFSISSTVSATSKNLSGGLSLASLIEQKTVYVLSDETTTDAISYSGSVFANGCSLTFDDISLDLSEIICDELNTTGTLSISNSKVIASSIDAADDITIDSSTVFVDSIVAATGLIIRGSDTKISGYKTNCALQLDAAFAIELDDLTRAVLSNIDISFVQSTNSIFDFSSNCDSILIDSVTVTANTSISLTNANSNTLCGFLKTNGFNTSKLFIKDCSISNRSSLVINSGVIDFLTIKDCDLELSGGVLKNTGTIGFLDINGVDGYTQTSTLISIGGVLSAGEISGVRVQSIFPLSSNFKLVSGNSATSNLEISNIDFIDISTNEALFTFAKDAVVDNVGISNSQFSSIFSISSGFINAYRLIGSDLSGNLLSGSGLAISDSNLQFSTSSNPINVSGSASSLPKIKIDNSILDFPSDTVFAASQYEILNSKIASGRFVFSNDTTELGSKLKTCDLSATNTAATISFDFNGLTDGPDGALPYTLTDISDNIFTGSPTSDLIRILPLFASKAFVSFYKNNCRFDPPTSGNSILRVGSTNTTNTYEIKDNIFSLGSGTLDKVFHLSDSNIVIDGNTILATGISSYIFGTSASTSQNNIRIFNNNIVGTVSADPTNFAGVLTGFAGEGNFQLFNNFGLPETMTFSLYGATIIEGSWTKNVDNLLTNILSDSGLIKELDLPMGRLQSLNIRAYAAGAPSTVNIYLYSQGNGMTAPYLIGSGTNSLSSVEQTINLTINDGTYYINNNEKIYLYIDTSANNNIFSNIVAKVTR